MLGRGVQRRSLQAEVLAIEPPLPRPRRFEPLHLKPLKHILHDVPLGFPSEIKARYPKTLHLPRPHLQPAGDFIAGQNPVWICWLQVFLRVAVACAACGAERREFPLVIAFGRSNGADPGH